jgi:glycerol-3-phosphate cytidylyltransferase-like family protein
MTTTTTAALVGSFDKFDDNHRNLLSLASSTADVLTVFVMPSDMHTDYHGFEPTDSHAKRMANVGQFLDSLGCVHSVVRLSINLDKSLHLIADMGPTYLCVGYQHNPLFFRALFPLLPKTTSVVKIARMQ